ncbi:hypothetical protein BDP27DRAFT_1357433 [Rhodocollybia butyracea]|uniref:Uncharacterized protein n=1 Tax=Rhodocollybia butyracea TaxID=206335 RepID=A0A9P5UFJ1_9AGAR|nr:hypothetical protein BDP27DRAFT_1357433 [Rhodocollybia butyracea]
MSNYAPSKLKSSVQNKEQYIQDKIKVWDEFVFFGITTTEYKLKISPRVFQFRQLFIYEFETPSVNSSPPSAEPEIGIIHKVKVISHNALRIQNNVIAGSDMVTEAKRSLGRKMDWQIMDKCRRDIAAASLGFNKCQPVCSAPPRTALFERVREGRAWQRGKEDLIAPHEPSAEHEHQDLEKGAQTATRSEVGRRGQRKVKSEGEVRGRLHRLLFFN